MELIPVESSFIASAGYGSGTLRIVFKDGKTKDYRAKPEDFAGFLAAPSKGKWFHEWLKPAARVTSGDGIQPSGDRTLHAVDEDKCCAKRLNAAIAAGSLDGKDTWICRRCGCEWKATMSGGLRHWQPVVFFERF